MQSIKQKQYPSEYAGNLCPLTTNLCFLKLSAESVAPLPDIQKKEAQQLSKTVLIQTIL